MTRNIDCADETTHDSIWRTEPTDRKRFEEEIIFASRWLLYPINFGLMIALVIYDLRFFQELWLLIVSAHSLSEEAVLSGLVGLLDKVMMTSLIILIIVGGHQVYIGKFKLTNMQRAPQWLDHVDTMILKVKVGLAFTGVSSVQLLKDFLVASDIPAEQLYRHIGMHLVFLVSTIVTAAIWRITHPAR